MTSMRIVMDADGEFPEFVKAKAEGKFIEGTVDVVAALPGGMSSGAPSASIVAYLSDGRIVFLEASLHMLRLGVDALAARHLTPDTPQDDVELGAMRMTDDDEQGGRPH